MTLVERVAVIVGIAIAVVCAVARIRRLRLALREREAVEQPRAAAYDSVDEEDVPWEDPEDVKDEPVRRKRPNRRRKAQKVRLAKQRARASTWHQRLLQDDE